MKTLEEYKQYYESYDVGHHSKEAFYTGYFIAKYEAQINEFHGMERSRSLTIDANGIELSGAKRQDVLDFLKIFGGKWNKTPNEFYKDTIDYTQNLELPFEERYYDFRLKASQAEPPPSCIIEEYEELVPAQVVKKKRMVCPKPTPDEATEVAEITEEPVNVEE